MTAYYNEIDPYAAQWLRNLIDAGHIACGDVDERSIVDVRADDLCGYTQCHFFAGVAGWSLALRIAGWPDDRPVWTGSCPCQPFSAAGAGKAGDDERHLWPAWFPLIAERRPPIVFGEQVEAAIGWGWLDLVFTDLEGKGYACGAAVLPACSVGAPHIRQRLWFVADADGGDASAEGLQRGGEQRQQPEDGRSCGVGNADNHNRRPELQPRGARGGQGMPSGNGWLGDPGHNGWPAWASWGQQQPETSISEIARSPSAVDGFWFGAEWIACTDGKVRPIEPGSFPLATGISNRMGRLRAYGNAIVPQVAAEFIRACC